MLKPVALEVSSKDLDGYGFYVAHQHLVEQEFATQSVYHSLPAEDHRLLLCKYSSTTIAGMWPQEKRSSNREARDVLTFSRAKNSFSSAWAFCVRPPLVLPNCTSSMGVWNDGAYCSSTVTSTSKICMTLISFSIHYICKSLDCMSSLFYREQIDIRQYCNSGTTEPKSDDNITQAWELEIPGTWNWKWESITNGKLESIRSEKENGTSVRNGKLKSIRNGKLNSKMENQNLPEM